VEVDESGGHYQKLSEAQRGLRKRIDEAYEKCHDDCPPGSPSKVPGWVRDLAYRDIPELVDPGTYADWLLIHVPGSDVAWGKIQTGLYITAGAAGTVATGGALLELGGAAAATGSTTALGSGVCAVAH
jgi:hypothetical protein